MRRRRFLGTVTGTTFGVSLAGCAGLLESSDDGSGGDDGQPPYDRFVPGDLPDVPARFGATLDHAAATEASDGALWPRTTPEDHDPLVYLGASLAGGVGLGAWILADDAGLASLVDDGGPTERIHTAPAYVLEGSFDVAGIASTLAENGFSEIDAYRGLDRYEAPETGQNVAFDEELVIFGGANESSDDGSGGTGSTDGDDGTDGSAEDPLAGITSETVVEATLDTARGDRSRASEELPAFADLGSAVPALDFVGSRYDRTGELFEPEPEDDGSISIVYDPAGIGIEGEAVGYAVAFDAVAGPNAETTFHLAIRYADAEAVDDEDALLDALAESASAPSIETDGATVTVEGTYTRSDS